MPVDGLILDEVTPDAPGLVLEVTNLDGLALGTVRSALVGRPGKQVLRWQAFRLDGTVAGPIWATRQDAAPNLLTVAQRLAPTE